MDKLEAVQEFLAKNSQLADLFTPEMEVQVNVVPGPERMDGEFKGKPWHGWRDPATKEEWKAFRIPWQASSEPNYKDKPLRFSLDKFAEAIGLTGWNWVKKQSHWVAFDIDSLVDHAKNGGLTGKQLDDVRDRLNKLDYATIRRSKGGSGLHVYVHFDPPVPDVGNHTEHACIARSLLAKMSAEVGYDLKEAVDKLGGNMWIWHRNTKPGGFQLLKQGVPLPEPPANWRAHLEVVEGRRYRVKVSDDSDATFEALIEKTRHTPLDKGHQKLVDWFKSQNFYSVWDSDRHMLICHTAALKKAHAELKLRGIFYTASEGKGGPNDYNCFMFPLRNGAWVVRRFGVNTKEHPAWSKDKKGWTKCLYNSAAELASAAAAHSGVEDKTGAYVFPTAMLALAALRDLDAPFIDLPDYMQQRETKLSKHKTPGKHVLRVKREVSDKGMEGWLADKKGDWWDRIIAIETEVEEQEPPDEVLRHVVSSGSDAGWFVNVKGDWVLEPKTNVYSVLDAMQVDRMEANKILGLAILNPWELVSEPFQEEYLPNRRWNRDAAQLGYKPSPGPHPTWDLIVSHTFAGLTQAVREHPWCQENGLIHGGDYGRCWLAALFQEPKVPLPYLFLWGPQNSGKSILHEAVQLLFENPRRGCVRADNALRNQSGFNGELAGGVLAVIEETNLRDSKDAYNKIKDWVTGTTIAIRDLYKRAYDAPNTLHFVQCANDPSYCPVMPGDTRITMCHVRAPDKEIGKSELLQRCRDEAPAFLHTLLHLELPRFTGRMRVPVLTTSDKEDQQEANKNELHQFIEDHCLIVPGHAVRISEFLEKFSDTLLPDVRRWWPKTRVSRELASLQIQKGRMGGEGYYWFGNLSFDRDAQPKTPLVRVGDRLVEAPNGTDDQALLGSAGGNETGEAGDPAAG